MSVSEYTRQHSAFGPGFHMSWSGPCFVLRDRGQEWFLEWHYYSGPTLCDRRTHGPRKTQPAQKSRFWLVAQWWFDQGGKVEDGVGVWKEPPIIETRWKKSGRNLTRDDKGDVVRRHYEGYESCGGTEMSASNWVHLDVAKIERETEAAFLLTLEIINRRSQPR